MEPAGAGRPAPASSARELRTTRVLRFAAGVTLASAVAFGLAWPLYFLTPVLATFFLSLPMPGPTVRQTLLLVVYVVAATALGLVFTLFLLPYPLVYVPALGLLLFHVFYLLNRGGHVFFVLMCLLAVLILPMLNVYHDQLAIGFALNFAVSTSLALLVYLLAHAAFPDPPGAAAPAPRRGPHRGYLPAAARNALKSTAAILPIVILFIALELTDELLVMVYAAIFSLAPDVAKGKASGAKSLISTLIGGAAAFVFYLAIIAVAQFPFFVALTLLTALLFGAGIFSDHPLSKYLASALIALLILVNGSMEADVDFTEKLGLRLVLISAATLYVVVALALAGRLLGERPGTEGDG